MFDFTIVMLFLLSVLFKTFNGWKANPTVLPIENLGYFYNYVTEMIVKSKYGVIQKNTWT